MIRWPIEFPWQIVGALVVAILCFLGACFCAMLAIGRTWRDRRRTAVRGDVPSPRDWTTYPNDFERDWWRK